MKQILFPLFLSLSFSAWSASDFSKDYKLEDKSSNNCAIRRLPDQKVQLYIGGQKIGDYDTNNFEQMESYRLSIKFWVYDSGACRNGYKIFLEK